MLSGAGSELLDTHWVQTRGFGDSENSFENILKNLLRTVKNGGGCECGGHEYVLRC